MGTVAFETEVQDKPTLTLAVAWLDGSDDDTSFDLVCGAGVGNPIMRLNVKHNGKSRTETVDIRDGVVAWVNRICDELDAR